MDGEDDGADALDVINSPLLRLLHQRGAQIEGELVAMEKMNRATAMATLEQLLAASDRLEDEIHAALNPDSAGRRSVRLISASYSPLPRPLTRCGLLFPRGQQRQGRQPAAQLVGAGAAAAGPAPPRHARPRGPRRVLQVRARNRVLGRLCATAGDAKPLHFYPSIPCAVQGRVPGLQEVQDRRRPGLPGQQGAVSCRAFFVDEAR